MRRRAEEKSQVDIPTPVLILVPALIALVVGALTSLCLAEAHDAPDTHYIVFLLSAEAIPNTAQLALKGQASY